MQQAWLFIWNKVFNANTTHNVTATGYAIEDWPLMVNRHKVTPLLGE